MQTRCTDIGMPSHKHRVKSPKLLFVQQLVQTYNQETSKPRTTGVFVRGNHPPVTGGFPFQKASNAEHPFPWIPPAKVRSMRTKHG